MPPEEKISIWLTASRARDTSRTFLQMRRRGHDELSGIVGKGGAAVVWGSLRKFPETEESLNILPNRSNLFRFLVKSGFSETSN